MKYEEEEEEEEGQTYKRNIFVKMDGSNREVFLGDIKHAKRYNRPAYLSIS